MGLFSKTPAGPAVTPAPAGTWKRLQDTRDSIADRPNLQTWDMAILERPDGKVVVQTLIGHADVTLAQLRANLFAEHNGVRGAGGWLAVHLPVANGDLWMYARGDRTYLGFRPPGGAVAPIGAVDPRLRELGPAAHCKAVQCMVGGALELDVQEAQRRLRAAEQEWGSYPPAQALRAAFLKQGGKPAEAARLLQAAVSKMPWDSHSHYLLGDTLDDLGRLPESLTAYDAAVRADPKNEDAWRDRGALLSKMGRPGDAMASYQKAIDLDSGEPSTRSNAAVLNYNAKRFGDAFRHLAAMDPHRAPPGSRPRQIAVQMSSEFAQTALANGKWEAAITAMELWQTFGDLDAKALHALGFCRLQLGERDGAVAAFRQALAKDPRYEKSRLALKELGVKAVPARPANQAK